MASKLTLSLALLGLTAAQKPGNTPDVVSNSLKVYLYLVAFEVKADIIKKHPALTTYRCTVADGCTESTNYLVLDSSAHWVHQSNNAGCGDWGSKPNATACPTKEACAEACVSK